MVYSSMLLVPYKMNDFNQIKAVMSFVGGKNIIVANERASKPEAEGLCAKQGLELMSLSSLTQLDSVQSFLGDIGELLLSELEENYTYSDLNTLGVSSNQLICSMQKVEGSGANWLGDLAFAIIPSKEPAGDCIGLGSIGLAELSCDMISNFVCQAPDPPNATPPPSLR
jgi:hypothetical protein